jgi:hypothetical protein
MNARLVEHKNKKSGGPDVPERVRAAAEILATTPGAPDYAAIAKAVGYTNARMLRRALSLPQSIRYLRDYKRQVLEQINAFNPEALRRVRDDPTNKMASVAAVRQLEIMQGGDEAAGVQRTPAQAAGVTIVFENAPASMRVLNPPVIEHEPGQHAWPSTD